ncbi:MAG: hypothetical protein EA379_07570 [Phycisphaerales bacterium]|nr:MAG: hypothetical protein EA379_07570 [Phycisphaerales bacterium]
MPRPRWSRSTGVRARPWRTRSHPPSPRSSSRPSRTTSCRSPRGRRRPPRSGRDPREADALATGGDAVGTVFRPDSPQGTPSMKTLSSTVFRSFVILGALLALLLPCGGAHAQDVSPNWFRAPAISPDGSTIVFVHGGDLYTVPVEGGRATPLTLHPSYNTRPVWSRDGSMIAFASDRHGDFDVFVMPAAGGEATRLTHHSADDFPSDFTPDGSAVIFESARINDVDAAVFPTPILAELYSVPVSGGTPTRVLTTPALNARFDRAGRRIIYEDRKGYEDEHRKHHTSSIARDIWIYDIAAGTHRQLTTHAAEDRNPHLTPDERSVVFLSQRNGDFNVFTMPLGAGGENQARQRTFFEHHPVRHLSLSNNGHAVFSWHGEIHHLTLAQDAEPRRVPIQILLDRGDAPVAETRRTGASEFSPAPNGKEIAFVLRGDVFVTSTEFDTTKRITNTPEQERSVEFAPCGRKLYYAGERNGSWNIYEASIADDNELYFFSATKINERPLVATDADEFQPRVSPDGKKIAYLHNRSTLKVLDIESGDIVTALPGTAFYSYSDGDYAFEWAPDSQHIAVHFYNRGRAFVHQIGVVKADGSQDWPIDISDSGYDDNSPRWAMKGGVVVWASDRYGMRSHGSWGAQYDVVGAFLTQDAYDRFHLSKEEYELRKELEEKRKKDEKKDEKKEDENGDDEGENDADNGDDAKKDDEKEAPEPIEIELDGLESRTVRLTIHASALGDFALAPDGDRLYYLARFEQGFDLWVRDFRAESTSMLRKLNAGSASMRLSDDGKTIYMLAGGSLSTINATSGDQKAVAFRAQLEIDGRAERAHLFDHVWRQTKKKFYRPDMHGVDWAFYRDQYAPKLAGVKTNRTFAELLSEILGELDASHTGGRYRPSPGDGDDRTASLGVYYDNNHTGDGARIAEIMEGGPLDKAEFDVEAGMVITRIDGVDITPATNLYALLNRKAGERTRLTLINPGADDAEPFDVVVRPVTLGAESELRYQRWVRNRRAIVDEASAGRLGYMHVRGMNDPSFRRFYADVLGRNFDREALIVDTRFNGGGWLHDDLVTFLTGVHYVDLHPRDDESPEVHYHGDSMWRWTKPSIVVMSEGNYSDAHFFPWAYTEVGAGDTVGMPVPGTTTAVWWERLHTGDLIFGIPQVGTMGKRGLYLENKQLEPTHKVPLPPEAAAAGRDTQVLEAVRIMLEKLDNE